MSKTLQIRDVPDALHRTITTRAARSGQSVSGYLLEMVAELESRPPMEEIVTRAQALARSGGGASSAEALAAVRSARDR